MGFLPDRSRVVLRHVIERHAAEQPNKECLIFEDGEGWTYSRALIEGYRAANVLAEMEIGRGENVLIFLPNGRDWIRAWWGVTFLGAIIVPVNTAYKGEMLKHVCQDSDSDYIITNEDLGERLKDINLTIKPIDPMLLIQGPTDPPALDPPLEPWDIHAIIYTSGTTGPSKGVIQPYLQTYMNGYIHWSRATPGDTILCDNPLYHTAGLDTSTALWSVGGRVALRTAFSASRYLDIVRQTGATMSLMVGTIAPFLYATPSKPDDENNPLRKVAYGGMLMDIEGFMKRFGIKELSTGFGMSEISPPILSQGPITNPKSCGKVRPGARVRLVDDHDIPVTTGEIGELIVRTDRPWELNAGYWRRPEETARSWRNGWFHTGDLFYCDQEGNYFFADRKKDAIRRRGENISSFEVETEVLAYPEVREAACVPAPAEFGEDEVKVFVVPREPDNFNPADLIRFLIPRMPYFMVPRYVEVVPELPRTPTMRIRKHKLRERGSSEATWDRESAGIFLKK